MDPPSGNGSRLFMMMMMIVMLAVVVVAFRGEDTCGVGMRGGSYS